MQPIGQRYSKITQPIHELSSPQNGQSAMTDLSVNHLVSMQKYSSSANEVTQ